MVLFAFRSLENMKDEQPRLAEIARQKLSLLTALPFVPYDSALNCI
jgi:hypothetical protein